MISETLIFAILTAITLLTLYIDRRIAQTYTPEVFEPATRKRRQRMVGLTLFIIFITGPIIVFGFKVPPSIPITIARVIWLGGLVVWYIIYTGKLIKMLRGKEVNES